MSNQLTIKNQIETMGPEFKKVLPRHIDLGVFIRTLQTAALNNPDLAKVDQRSLFLAATKSAEIGLMCNNREAALIPYKGTVQFIAMVDGLVKLIHETGLVSTIIIELVYANDKFDYYIDETGQKLIHRPVFKDRGDFVLVYCLVLMKDGSRYIEKMYPDEIELVKSSSRAQNGPWKTHREAMIRKSVLRKIFKILPKGSNDSAINKAIESDQEMDFREVNEPSAPKAKAPQQSRLKQMLGVEKKKEEVVPEEEAPHKEWVPSEEAPPMPDEDQVIDVPNSAPSQSNIPI